MSRRSPRSMRAAVCAAFAFALAACGGPSVAVEVVNESARGVDIRVEVAGEPLGTAEGVRPDERRRWAAALDRAPRADGSYDVTLRTDGNPDTVVRAGYVTGRLLADSLRVTVRDRAVVVAWREQGRWVREAVAR